MPLILKVILMLLVINVIVNEGTGKEKAMTLFEEEKNEEKRRLTKRQRDRGRYKLRGESGEWMKKRFWAR